MKYLCLAYYDEKRFDTLSAADLEAIGRACRPHDQALRATGRLVAQASLGSPRSAACIRPRNGRPVVTDGPFAETKELIAGFWLWRVKSMDESVEWDRRCPNPMPGESEIEIRPVFEAEDFGAEFTPELRAQEQRLRRQIEGRGERSK